MKSTQMELYEPFSWNSWWLWSAKFKSLQCMGSSFYKFFWWQYEWMMVEGCNFLFFFFRLIIQSLVLLACYFIQSFVVCPFVHTVLFIILPLIGPLIVSSLPFSHLNSFVHLILWYTPCFGMNCSYWLDSFVIHRF